jgi:hypothetical protein
MNFKPFHIHHFNNGNVAKKTKFRGFTAVVSPGKDERQVDVSMSFCSKNDVYCRKTGVQRANDSESEGFRFTCNARDLLSELDDKAESINCHLLDERGYYVTDKQFLYKYLF